MFVLVFQVQTGFGRTGTHFWGFQGYDADPDIGNWVYNRSVLARQNKSLWLYCIFKLISSSNIMEAKNNCICIFIFPEEISVLQNSSKSIQFIINGQLQNFHFLCGSVIYDCYNYSMPEKLHTLLKLKIKGHLRQV